jgi:DNA-binding transcriptional LysR family regulator
MTLHQMNIFHKIIETQGFANAGEKLFLSEPSVSAQFKSFEKSLGLVLIDRQQSSKTNGIVLTEDGQFVYDAVQRILADWNSILEISQNQGNKNVGIKLVTNSPVGTYLLPGLLSEFNNLHPNMKIKLLVHTNYYDLIKMAKGQAYDICITPAFKNISLPDIVYSFKTQIVLVTSNQEFYANKKLPLPAINNLLLLTPPLNSVVREVLNNFFDELSFRLKSSMELDLSESVKRVLLTNNNYYALLSSISIRDELKAGSLRIVQTDPPLPYIEYVILKRGGKSQQTRIKNFLDYLISNIESYLPQDD